MRRKRHACCLYAWGEEPWGQNTMGSIVTLLGVSMQDVRGDALGYSVKQLREDAM